MRLVFFKGMSAKKTFWEERYRSLDAKMDVYSLLSSVLNT